MSKKNKPNPQGLTILVIPDSHDDPEVSQERYEWAGRLIVDLRPDVVVELGDFADMNSISSYDKGTVKAENKRLSKDIESAKEARRKLTQPLRDFQENQRRQKVKLYTPRLIALAGNHEHRIQRLMQNDPSLHGCFSQDVSDAAGQGWEFHPFGELVDIHGVSFTHYFTKPGTGRGYSGEYAAMHMIKDWQCSMVSGHSHRWEFKNFRTPKGRECNALVAGCYFDHYMDYAQHDNHRWKKGLTVLRNVQQGHFDIEFLSMKAIQHRYAEPKNQLVVDEVKPDVIQPIEDSSSL